MDKSKRTPRDARPTTPYETIGWIASTLAVAGVVLNNLKLWPCFVLWIVSNGLSAWIHWRSSLRSLFWRDVVFLALAVVGLVMWTT